MIVAEGDLVIVHGRFSGFGAPVNWIAADILRIQDGILVEHRDALMPIASRISCSRATSGGLIRINRLDEVLHFHWRRYCINASM